MGNGFLSAFNKGRLVDVKIVKLLNTDSNTKEYHGLVRVEPDNVAEKVIKRLNRKPFKGMRINVREYNARTWHNDPRLGISSTMKSLNYRKRDRRRRNVEVINDIDNLKFSSSSSFHRVL
jgi:hypothetical protein